MLGTVIPRTRAFTIERTKVVPANLALVGDLLGAEKGAMEQREQRPDRPNIPHLRSPLALPAETASIDLRKTHPRTQSNFEPLASARISSAPGRDFENRRKREGVIPLTQEDPKEPGWQTFGGRPGRPAGSCRWGYHPA